MTQSDSFDWQRLGTAWRSGDRGGDLPPVNVAALRQRLDRQRMRLVIYTTIEILILVAALAWGLWLLTLEKTAATLGGVMVITIALPNLVLIWWARRGSFAADDQSVQGMLDLAITRARGSVRYVQSVYAIGALAIIATSVVVSVRALDPAMQLPGFKRLVFVSVWTSCYVVIVIAVAYYYERKFRRRLDGFRHMREALVTADIV